MGDTVERIYCCDNGRCCGNSGNSVLEAMALLNGNNGGFGRNGDDLLLLLFILMGQRGWNGWNNGGGGMSPEYASLQNQAQDNQNANLLRDALRDNYSAIQALAQNLNCDFNTLQSCCCDLKQAIATVGGQIGFSAEKVINAVGMGNLNIIQALKDCCCQTQKMVLEQGYQNQLGQKDIINGMLTGFDRTSTGLERGFAQVGYDGAKNTCDIIQAGKDNTQRIIDTMNSHRSDDQTRLIQDLKNENSRLKQTDAIVAAVFARLNGNNGYGNNCGCGNGCGF